MCCHNRSSEQMNFATRRVFSQALGFLGSAAIIVGSTLPLGVIFDTLGSGRQVTNYIGQPQSLWPAPMRIIAYASWDKCLTIGWPMLAIVAIVAGLAIITSIRQMKRATSLLAAILSVILLIAFHFLEISRTTWNVMLHAAAKTAQIPKLDGPPSWEYQGTALVYPAGLLLLMVAIIMIENHDGQDRP